MKVMKEERGEKEKIRKGKRTGGKKVQKRNEGNIKKAKRKEV
jgi:hypothetical protein